MPFQLNREQALLRVMMTHVFSRRARCFSSKAVLDDLLKNTEAYKHNLTMRKSKINIDLVLQLAKSDPSSPKLEKLLKDLPNHTHPSVANVSEPIELDVVGEKSQRCLRLVENACAHGVLLRGQDYTKICGDRTYFLTGDFVRLERALVRFTVDRLKKHKFKLVSVPDILTADQIEACGMQARGQRSQIYRLRLRNLAEICLSGTAEIALANLFGGKTFVEGELPLKLCATSRCFRAEVSTVKEEKGLYRVHQFTKVEMFGITEGNIDASQKLHQEFVEIEKELFSDLGLHYKVLDMPPIDLGKPAYRKIDLETWMSGHRLYGEISSTSDCTDYQAGRLDINYCGKPAHTVNGTACAIPRMLIALGETYNSKGDLCIPEALQSYMGGLKKIRHQPSFKNWKKISMFHFENRILEEDVDEIKLEKEKN